jgi:hypothetical protein
LRLAEGACQGLAAVHAAGLVHRDIKPANLFLVAERYSERCKILDFGVVKLGSTSSTRGGAILGTVRYMAPEQLIDSASVGAACDLYGLGAVLYQCLTGRLPHAADSEPELMFEILNRPAPPLAKLRPDLPVALTALVDQALAKDPGARPSSAHVFHERLAEAREHTTLSVHTARSTVSELTGERLSALGARRRALKLQRNRTLLYWGVGLTLGVGVAGGAAWRSRPTPPNTHGNALRLATKPVASTASIAPAYAAAKPVPSGPTATPSALATRRAPEPAPSGRAGRTHLRADAPAAVAKSPASGDVEPGRLQIGADPTWASVRLDGASVGSTPLLLRNVASGQHVVEAQALGTGAVERRVVDLAAGEQQRVLFHFGQ